MIVELIIIGLVVSAYLAIYFDEVIYSIASLLCMFILITALYALNNAVFAAIFQIAVSAGTLAVLFLTGEMLSEKPVKEKPLKKFFLFALIAILLSLPSAFISTAIIPSNISSGLFFADALWNFRALDVILQGLVVMVVALGIALVLHERGEGER